MAKAKQGQKMEQRAKKAKVNGVKKTKQFKKKKGSKILKRKSVQNEVKAQTEQTTDTEMFTGGFDVDVDIPKHMKTFSHEAVQKILSYCKTLDCQIRSISFKFEKKKVAEHAVKGIRKININRKYVLVSSTGHQLKKKEEKIKLLRIFRIPVDSSIDLSDVKKYFNAVTANFKTKTKVYKVFQLVFESEEVANKAMKKTMELDDLEITLSDPALHQQTQTKQTKHQGKGEEKKRKSHESTAGKKKKKKKGRIVLTEEEHDDESDDMEEDTDDFLDD